MTEDLGYGNQPDDDFEKAKQSSHAAPAATDHDNPDGANTDITDAGAENKKR
jgi:hypothetical protein